MKFEENTTPITIFYGLGKPRERHSSKQAMPYLILHQSFKYEVIYDVAPLDVCDILLGQPYMY